MFITGLILRFNHETYVLESINAGHHEPLCSTPIEHQSGIPFGVMSDIVYQTSETQLKKGDTLLLFTDGILEEENEAGEMYEKIFYQNYHKVQALESKAKIESILKEFHAFIKEQHDDVTLLAIEVN